MRSPARTTVGVLGGRDPRGHGGVESVVRNIASHSPDTYEYVQYCSGDDTRVEESDIGQIRSYARGVGPLQSKHVSSVRASWDLREREIDLVHGHGDNCIGLTLFGTTLPYVVTFHGTAAGMYANVFGDSGPHREALSCLRMYPERAAAKQCDVAVACSVKVREELVTHYDVDPGKIVVIRNGVDPGRFAPVPPDEAARRLGLSLDQQYVLWIGVDPRRKRLETAVRVVESMDRDVTLLVAGTDGEDTDRVRYLGHVADERMADLYSAVAALLFPSLYEGDPLVILEALACGTPVVASPYMPAFDIGVSSVSSHEVESYARELASTLADPPERDPLRQYALTRDWDQVVTEYVNVYDGLL